MYHIFFIHSSVDGHLGCFHVLAFYEHWIPVFFQIIVFSAYLPRNGIAVSYDSFIISFLRALHTVFHSDCNNLHSHQEFHVFLKIHVVFLKELFLIHVSDIVLKTLFCFLHFHSVLYIEYLFMLLCVHVIHCL